jgi:hypothetical protein
MLILPQEIGSVNDFSGPETAAGHGFMKRETNKVHKKYFIFCWKCQKAKNSV